MTLHPDKTHLYVGVRPAFGIVSYRIEADGTLQQAGMAPLPGSPTHISTDLQGVTCSPPPTAATAPASARSATTAW